MISYMVQGTYQSLFDLCISCHGLGSVCWEALCFPTTELFLYLSKKSLKKKITFRYMFGSVSELAVLFQYYLIFFLHASDLLSSTVVKYDSN